MSHDFQRICQCGGEAVVLAKINFAGYRSLQCIMFLQPPIFVFKHMTGRFWNCRQCHMLVL